MSNPGRLFVRLVLIWGWLPALLGAFWLFIHVMMPGFKINQSFPQLLWRWFLPHGDLGGLTALTWLLIAINLLITMIAVLMHQDEYGRRGEPAMATRVLSVVSGLTACLVVVWPLPAALWDNDKDGGRYYSQATVFHIPDATNPPGSVTDLLAGSNAGDRRRCDRTGQHDVGSCVKVDGSLAGMRWEARTSSLAAARTAMNNAASPVQRVDVMDDTLTYLYGEAAGTGRWSAVLDGSGIRQPMYGVAEWDGTTNTARVCRFGGAYRVNRAFEGGRKNNLRNLLAERHRTLVFNDTDIWGYCENNRPVIVIPVQRQIGRHNRTVTTAGGVLVLRGSPSGRPVTEYRARVRPGELPGPVYPISLVRTQRDATQWAAGREHKNRSAFGFERSDFETQSENRGEYLLRGSDRRLYYVTPLTPRESKSQSLVAYGIAPADQVDSGRLNRYDVHVLPDGDPSIASLATLNAQAVSYISGPTSPFPNFLNSGGRLQEFLPLGGDLWRVYGVQNGQTVFYIDLSASGRIQPQAVTGRGQAAPPAGTGDRPEESSDCGRPVKELSQEQLTECLGEFADELRRRSQGN